MSLLIRKKITIFKIFPLTTSQRKLTVSQTIWFSVTEMIIQHLYDQKTTRTHRHQISRTLVWSDVLHEILNRHLYFYHFVSQWSRLSRAEAVSCVQGSAVTDRENQRSCSQENQTNITGSAQHLHPSAESTQMLNVSLKLSRNINYWARAPRIKGPYWNARNSLFLLEINSPFDGFSVHKIHET